MIRDEPKAPRADTFAAIFDAALLAWATRWWLYVAIALASIAAQAGIAILRQYDVAVVAIAFCIVDGLATAFVTIDVGEYLRDEPRPLRVVLRAALLRWPVVALVLACALVIEAAIYPWLFNPEQTYGIGMLPALLVFGILGIASVIASLDETRPYWALPGFALLQSFLYAGAWPNMGRLILAGAMLAVPMMLQEILEHWLATKGIAPLVNSFWSNIPVDALTLAPFQAFFTYLYLDFKARDEAKR